MSLSRVHPTLVQTQIALEDEIDGQLMIVDGFTGKYYIEPDEKTIAEMKQKQHTAQEHEALLMA
ncbi:MAG: hypothetical protein RSC13_07950 [Clostridium sp.]